MQRGSMLRVSEEEGSRKRESYVESYRQLGRTLLDLQSAADRIFDVISQRVSEERSTLTEISRRIQSVKAQINELAHSGRPLTIKSPSRYPSGSIQQDFRPLFAQHAEDSETGSSVTNLLVNGGLNREFGTDGTLELFQFFSEENIEYPLKEAEAKEGVKLGNPKQDFLEKILEAPKYADDSFLALDTSDIASNLNKKKNELPPAPPSLLKNFTSLTGSSGFTFESFDDPARNIR